MRIFAQLDQNNLVTAILYTMGVPGDTASIPAGFIELTDRLDGPWAGKIYTAATDSFAWPAVTKASLERTALAKYDLWLVWKNTRQEAQVRSLAAGIITALIAKENAAWGSYAQSLMDWYNTP